MSETEADPSIGGSGARLISVGEGAEILGVSAETVREWIATDQILYVTLPSGEQCLQLVDEVHPGNATYHNSGYLLKLHESRDDGAPVEAFGHELSRKQREQQLASLDPGEVDVDALALALVERLAPVLPTTITVSTESGMVWVKNAQGGGAASDVASLVSDQDLPTAERVRRAAEHALETTQDMIAEETTSPWPAQAGDVPGGFPAACADIVDEHVRLWYGDPDSPILELSPINLPDVCASGTE